MNAAAGSVAGDAGWAPALRALAVRLGCDRPLVVLDLETTGSAPALDRIVEIAVVRVEPCTRVSHLATLVHPGVPIPPEATAIHGITDDAVASAPPFTAIARDVATLLEDADLCGYNLRRFDVPVLAAELARAGLSFSLTGRRIFDPFVIFRRQEPRGLGAAVRFYCDDTHAGHRAVEDVAATIRVLSAQLDRYAEALPCAPDALHAYCEDRQPSWVDAEGKIVWRGDEACWNLGRQAGRPLRELARLERGFLKWVLERDFPADTKTIVQDALAGRFPVRTPAGPGDD